MRAVEARRKGRALRHRGQFELRVGDLKELAEALVDVREDEVRQQLVLVRQNRLPDHLEDKAVAGRGKAVEGQGKKVEGARKGSGRSRKGSGRSKERQWEGTVLAEKGSENTSERR